MDTQAHSVAQSVVEKVPVVGAFVEAGGVFVDLGLQRGLYTDDHTGDAGERGEESGGKSGTESHDFGRPVAFESGRDCSHGHSGENKAFPWQICTMPYLLPFVTENSESYSTRLSIREYDRDN